MYWVYPYPSYSCVFVVFVCSVQRCKHILREILSATHYACDSDVSWTSCTLLFSMWKKYGKKLYGIACLAVDFILLDLIQNSVYVKISSDFVQFYSNILRRILYVAAAANERCPDSAVWYKLPFNWYITYEVPWCTSYMCRGDAIFRNDILECGGAIVPFRGKNIELILKRFE